MLFVFAFSKYSMVNNFTGEFASRQQILSKHCKILVITEFQITGTIVYCPRLNFFGSLNQNKQCCRKQKEKQSLMKIPVW